MQETVLVTEDHEDAEQTQKFLDRAEQLHAAEENTEERPDWLPAEFNSVSEFVEGYNALKPQEETAEETEEESSDAAEEENEGEEESSQDDAPQVDFDALTSEYADTGSLSDETLAALEAQGFPRGVVEAHLDGIEARAELTRMKVANALGGEEQFEALLAWAGENLSEAEIDAVNNHVASNDFDGYLLALQGVHTRYEAAYGSFTPPALSGATSLSTEVYDSDEQMKADMRDPRYGKDEAFRNKVAAKVHATRNSRK